MRRKIQSLCKRSGRKKPVDATAGALPANEEFERCVICGRVTSVPISMPVEFRGNYEVGIGQLCAQCNLEREQ